MTANKRPPDMTTTPTPESDDRAAWIAKRYVQLDWEKECAEAIAAYGSSRASAARREALEVTDAMVLAARNEDANLRVERSEDNEVLWLIDTSSAEPETNWPGALIMDAKNDKAGQKAIWDQRMSLVLKAALSSLPDKPETAGGGE